VRKSFVYAEQGTRNQRQREAARKSEAVVGSTQTDSRNKNFDRTVGDSNKDEGEVAAENVLQPPDHGPKDSSNRKPKDNKDMAEKVRVNVSSREFVRGGRGRLRGSARGRGHGGHQDVDGSASHRTAESATHRGSADDTVNARQDSAPSNPMRTNGTEQKRAGNSRIDSRQPKMDTRKLSHETSVRPQQMSIKGNYKGQRDGHGAVQLPSSDQGSNTEDLLQSNIGSTAAKDIRQRNETPSQLSRHRTEFYDSRNRGQKIRPSDARAYSTGKPHEQSKWTDAKVSSRNTPGEDGVVAEKSAAASSQDIADTSSNKHSNEAASEQTSQRKSGEKRSCMSVICNRPCSMLVSGVRILRLLIIIFACNSSAVHANHYNLHADNNTTVFNIKSIQV